MWKEIVLAIRRTSVPAARRVLGALIVLAVTLPTTARAQDQSHWGLTGSVIPQWQVPSQLEVLFDGNVNLKGTDFAIGIARGRESGGDWGVSYVHKRVKDGSRVDSSEPSCEFFANGCFRFGESLIAQRVALNGIEAHKFVPFATIKNRVQIGMNFAGGVGTFRGNLEKHDYDVDFASFDSRTGQVTGRQIDRVSSAPASELMPLSVVPLGKVQAAVGVLVAPGLKIRAQGGFDFPGYEKFSVAGVYLFGSK